MYCKACTAWGVGGVGVCWKRAGGVAEKRRQRGAGCGHAHVVFLGKREEQTAVRDSLRARNISGSTERTKSVKERSTAVHV